MKSTKKNHSCVFEPNPVVANHFPWTKVSCIITSHVNNNVSELEVVALLQINKLLRSSNKSKKWNSGIAMVFSQKIKVASTAYTGKLLPL